MEITFNKTSYKNFGNCIEISNGIITLMVTIDFGPRIIYFSRIGMENVLFEDEERRFTEICENCGVWVAFGGHRLWLAPEVNPETYYPDNANVEYVIKNDEITLTPPQTSFGKQFELKIKMSKNEPVVQIVQSIKNKSESSKTFAPWSITSLAKGGVCMIPLSKRESGYLPNRAMSFWDYTDINDPRFMLENDHATVKQDASNDKPFKAGFNVEEGFVAVDVNEQVFIKSVPPYKDVKYPDFSSNFEVYTNALFLECEIVGEMRSFEPETAAYLEESWHIFNKNEVYTENENIQNLIDNISHL